MGDGSFYFCNPASMHAVSRQYGLPILTVVLDNGGWAAVKASTLRMYPKGVAYNTDEFASRLMPDVDFARMAETMAELSGMTLKSENKNVGTGL